MAWIIKKTDGRGGYVARPGSASSYTRDLAKAQRFPTREAAERERCLENEQVVDLRDYFIA